MLIKNQYRLQGDLKIIIFKWMQWVSSSSINEKQSILETSILSISQGSVGNISTMQKMCIALQNVYT